MTSQAHAGFQAFIGEDIQPASGPPVLTNSDFASSNFQTAAEAIGKIGTINFESAPLGAFTNLTVASGVSMNGTDQNGSAQTIRNSSASPGNPSLDGSNTTPGGSQFVEMNGGSLTFTFFTPTQFFGVFLTGVQTNFYSESVTFSDGTTRSIALQGGGTSVSVGEIAFLGFVDSGKSITSITINAGAPGPGAMGGEDAIGVDDVSYMIPEPSSLVLCGLALVPACWFARSRRRD